MNLPKSILIRELGPREGFQTLSKVVATEQKIELIEALSLTGVRFIEVTSFVRADRVPQMADAVKLANDFKPHAGIQYAGLYLNQKGFELAQQAKNIKNDAWLYTSASESFLRRNNNQTFAQLLDSIPAWIEVFKKSNMPLYGLMISNAFGCNEEGKISQAVVFDQIAQISDRLSQQSSRLKEICFADTVGLANPEQVKGMVAFAKNKYPEIKIGLHLHDTRGTGLANAYAGLTEGVDIFDASVGGLGGCPFAKGAAGNICTEDFALMCEEMGVKTGLNLDQYVLAAKLAERIVGHKLAGKYYSN